MPTLYYRPSCSFCVFVLHFAQDNDISLELRNINENQEFVSELIEKGGKVQVPFLVDENGGGMYESDEIVAYLKERYGK